MAQAMTLRLADYLPQEITWQRVLGVAILTLLLIQVLAAPVPAACGI
jgi:hypothetical protein